MTFLILGLILFLVNHSVKLFAASWRTKFIEEKGENTWKGLYSVASIASLVLIIYGFGLSRADPVFLWTPPPINRLIAIVLTFFAFMLLAASSIPRNHLKQKLGHPMYAGVKIWAFAHLISNGRLGDTLLFGCFLVWAIAGFSVSRKRDRLAGVVYEQGTLSGTAMVSSAGTVAYAVFAFYLHRLLIGVPPF